jgi:hypothetical protein
MTNSLSEKDSPKICCQHDLHTKDMYEYILLLNNFTGWQSVVPLTKEMKLCHYCNDAKMQLTKNLTYITQPS